ncbi:MAG: hypothetical protein COA47_13380 [Robiginitomaculum sp.]|nr:MAG: hypothetical protein COA47_13380 [Robiginitomaculum sp.]
MAFAIGFPLAGLAQQGREDAEQLEQLRDEASTRQVLLEEKATRTQTQIRNLQVSLIDVAARIDQQNQRSVIAEDHLFRLQQKETVQTKALLADQMALRQVLAALQRSEMSPPPPLAVSAGDMLAAVRANILLGATAPELQSRAKTLQKSLIELKAVRVEIQTGQQELEQQMAALDIEQVQLQSLLGQRQKLETELRGDARLASNQVRTLSERAANVRELIRQLEAEAQKSTPSLKPNATPSQPVLAPRLKPGRQRLVASLGPVWHSPTGRFTDSRGQLELPVQGLVLARFGEAENPDKIGGMVIRTSRRAQIISPYDARVAFAGKFRNYGRLLILDVGEGYHMVLSGLAVTYVVKGQTVLAGEPVGKMVDRRKPAPEFYLEFRKLGQPFDPEPWLKKAIKAG